MPFQKGDKKPPSSGRKPGTGNKAKATVRKRLKELGHDPIEALVQIAREAYADGERNIALQANKELLSYAQPKLKSIDINTQGDNTVHLTWTTGVPEGEPEPVIEQPQQNTVTVNEITDLLGLPRER